MQIIDIARKLAALGQKNDACQAYTVALHGDADPALKMEAALYLLENGGDYKVSYTCFRDLYNQGHFRQDVLSIMTQAFYEPNESELKKRYERNCALLQKYPYCFREDFLPFQDLPIRFYPYDDDGYLPFNRARAEFGAYLNFKKPVVSRNFFKDLENPILADDVYSQYELEYLNDNVRKSEYIGRENHIYLHYTDWSVFCAHLQCLDLRPLLREEKFVFLMEDEAALYPIDFQERFGIDYSQYPVKPIGIREVNKLIWHTQLSSHNGGDFFNEILDGHPNMLTLSSLFMDKLENQIKECMESLNRCTAQQELWKDFGGWKEKRLVRELFRLRDRTAKDMLVAMYINEISRLGRLPDSNTRIAPALLFQPHFGNLVHDVRVDEERNRAILTSEQYDVIRQSSVFRNFKYIKTFTPLRRPTTSHGAAVRYMRNEKKKAGEDSFGVFPDELLLRMLNRSFMIDPQDRLFQDCVLVRFEDGKLNPKALFTALAEFLDIPYTESMTYCSLEGVLDPEQNAGNARGFDPVTVYRTYDGYISDTERYFLEFFLRDAYEAYGYGFQWYDGAAVDEARVEELTGDSVLIDGFIRDSWKPVFEETVRLNKEGDTRSDLKDLTPEDLSKSHMEKIHGQRLYAAKTLLRGLRFVSKEGQPLRMMPKLELDPALLEQPLYH